MRIEKLSLKNFRGFEELEINFPEGKGGLVVFIGVNGSGKSSVLENIFIHLVNLPRILRSRFQDRQNTSIYGGLNYAECIKINSIKTESVLEFKVKNNSFESRFYIQKNEPRTIFSNFFNKSEIKNRANKRVGIPIVAFYQTDRNVTMPSLKAKDLNVLNLEKSLQLDIDETIDFNYFFEWFRNTEDYENEQRLNIDSNYRHSGLEVFRKILSIFLEGYENPRVRRQPIEKLVLEKGKDLLSVTQLSHGEKLMFAIIGDIIRRISITQPNLENPSLGEGIVMIDEIEQHLHPSWQRTIIPNLRKTFPNIQFIVTTHSPQVLSNVPKENVFILEDFRLVEKTPPTLGRDTNSILYDLFGVEERPEKAKEEFQKLYKLIDDPDAEELAKSMLNEMEIKYGTEDAEIVRAKLHLEFLTR